MALPAKYRYYLFVTMGSLIVTGLSSVLVWASYHLIEPHLSPLFWSLCTALVLLQFKTKIKNCIDWMQSHLVTHRTKRIIKIIVFSYYVYNVLHLIKDWDRHMSSGDAGFILGYYVVVLTVLLMPIMLSSDMLATCIILIGGIAVCILLIYAVLKMSYAESNLVLSRVQSFLHSKGIYLKIETGSVEILSSGGTCNFIRSFGTTNHRLLKKLQEIAPFSYVGGDHLANLTYIDKSEFGEMMYNTCTSYVESIKGNLNPNSMSDLGWFGSTISSFFQTGLNTLNFISELLSSIFIYFMFLFYFVKNGDFFQATFSRISPLSEQENTELLTSMNNGVVKTFQYAILVAFCRFAVTFVSFSLVGFKILWVFAFLSAFLSLIPVLSSWVVWVPASLYLLSQDGLWSWNWIIVSFSHVALIFLDSAVHQKFFKGQQSTMLGIGIILGIYTYGWSGLIKGPLVFGVTLTLYEIYQRYMDDCYPSAQLFDNSPVSPVSPSNPFTPNMASPSSFYPSGGKISSQKSSSMSSSKSRGMSTSSATSVTRKKKMTE